MAEITKLQLKKILANAPLGSDNRSIVEGLIMKGHTIEGLDPVTTNVFREQKRQSEVLSGNQFEQEKPKTLWEKARDFTAGIIGGGKLAEGLGQAMSANEVRSSFDVTYNSLAEQQKNLIEKYRDAVNNGEDTSKIKELMKLNSLEFERLADANNDYAESLATNKEVIGSATRLAATIGGGALAGGVSKGGSGTLQVAKGLEKVGGIGQAFGVGKATTVTGGALRGAGAGATTGAIEGAIQGGGLAAEKDASAGGIVGGSLAGLGFGAVTGGVLGGVVGGVTGKLRGIKEFQEEATNLLKNNPDARVAKYQLDGSGKIQADRISREAIKQGVDEGVVATVKGSSATDKIKMNQMVDIVVKGQTDPKYAATNRASDVIGDSVLERFKVVQKANVQAAKSLDGVAKSLRGQKIDPVPAVQSFIDDLDDLGVKFEGGKANFSGSQIEGLKEPQSIINTIVKRIKETSDDGYDWHNIKKFIDEQVSYGKSSGGLTGKTENILKGFRSNIDGILDTTFDSYNKVNTNYAVTRDAIDDFLIAAGSKFDINAPNANARIGTLSRRILSNAQSRTQVLNSLLKIQETAEQFGGKFDDDVITQVVFFNDLERLFGTSAPTSLAGETAKAVRQGGTIAQKLKDTQGIFDLALQATGEGIEKARGINREGLISSIRALLK